MKIESSNMQLAGQRQFIEKHSIKESLTVWVGKQRPGNAASGRRPDQNERHIHDRVSLSRQGLANANTPKTHKSEDIDTEKALENDPRMQIIKRMLEALTGEKINLTNVSNLKSPNAEVPLLESNPQSETQSDNALAGFGIEYDRIETHYEAEQTTFSAQGLVKTTDGKTIQLSVQLAMSREYFEQSELSVRLGDAVMKDPLVLNFNGQAAQLTDAKFNFDIDSDGSADPISFVNSGSGFLVIDKNQDGIVNNGNELFGAATGNGFAELAAYDNDNNSWIDENDAVFEHLRVWTKDAQGNDALTTLKENQVGAIYLGNVHTAFSLKSSQNQLHGQIRSTGLFLNEDGTAGTVQQIDLAV